MTHSVDKKDAQRAACGICARSGSIKPVKIIFEFSNRKDGAASEQANRDKRQQEAAHSSCTKALGSCHEVKFSSGFDCCRNRMFHHRLASRQGFLLALARAKGRSHSKQLFDPDCETKNCKIGSSLLSR